LCSDPLEVPEVLDGTCWFCVFGEIWSLLTPVLPAFVCWGPFGSPSRMPPGRLDDEPDPLLCVLLLD